ncbi:hypothetical protein Sme01_21300 [Sphaerisporangium melleum]|uniref:Glucanase n=1 Tax=Sphaerisporangium melleum TaxID=321316 RepID=A0A917RN94_9ACTN|nr:hypothetical protein GCM10007964_67100 [Sphaerisporangium melleum]GII69654.1 hypothetical protein Sme01_21300 [Sphaerisporangium melleum]
MRFGWNRSARGILTAATTLVATLLAVGMGTAARAAPANPAPVVPVDNPFAGVKGYVDAGWAGHVETSAAAVGGADADRIRTLRNVPTAVWLDRIADIATLTDHLDAALKQGAGYITLVLYDLPDKNCWSTVSDAELHASENGLQRYKTEFIDPIAAIVARPEYQSLRVATIIEPRSLAYLVTGLNTFSCTMAAQSGVYIAGIRYALDTLTTLPNVYTYLDVAHAGWTGWENTFTPLAALVTATVQGTSAGLRALDGIATNVADYIPTLEPFLPNPELNVGGAPVRSARFYEGNPYFGERDYATAMRQALIARGFPTSLGAVIDTSRNGWGGPDRPAAVSTSADLDTYVNESRLDRRPHRFSPCNQNGAGLGARPVAGPLPGVDAYLWIKPPGESDGAGGPLLPPGTDRLVDPMCDPSRPNRWDQSVQTNALRNAPAAGDWHHEQFLMLVRNAYPPL